MDPIVGMSLAAFAAALAQYSAPSSTETIEQGQFDQYGSQMPQETGSTNAAHETGDLAVLGNDLGNVGQENFGSDSSGLDNVSLDNFDPDNFGPVAGVEEQAAGQSILQRPSAEQQREIEEREERSNRERLEAQRKRAEKKRERAAAKEAEARGEAPQTRAGVKPTNPKRPGMKRGHRQATYQQRCSECRMKPSETAALIKRDSAWQNPCSKCQ